MILTKGMCVNLRLVRFKCGSGSRAAAEGLSKKLVLWGSRDAADAAAGVIGPILMGGVKEANGTMDSPRLFDVFEA